MFNKNVPLNLPVKNLVRTQVVKQQKISLSTFFNNLHTVSFFGRSVHSFFSFCAEELKYELEQSRGIKSTNESATRPYVHPPFAP